MDENELKEALTTATDILAHCARRIEEKNQNTFEEKNQNTAGPGPGGLPSETSTPTADPGFLSTNTGEKEAECNNDRNELTRREERAQQNFR